MIWTEGAGCRCVRRQAVFITSLSRLGLGKGLWEGGRCCGESGAEGVRECALSVQVSSTSLVSLFS